MDSGNQGPGMLKVYEANLIRLQEAVESADGKVKLDKLQSDLDSLHLNYSNFCKDGLTQQADAAPVGEQIKQLQVQLKQKQMALYPPRLSPTGAGAAASATPVVARRASASLHDVATPPVGTLQAELGLGAFQRITPADSSSTLSSEGSGSRKSSHSEERSVAERAETGQGSLLSQAAHRAAALPQRVVSRVLDVVSPVDSPSPGGDETLDHSVDPADMGAHSTVTPIDPNPTSHNTAPSSQSGALVVQQPTSVSASSEPTTSTNANSRSAPSPTNSCCTASFWQQHCCPRTDEQEPLIGEKP